MKKMIIAFAAMAVAIISNAASIDWKINGVSADLGKDVYILMSVADTYTSVADISANALASGSIAKVGSRSYYASGTITDAAITKATDKLYAIILDTDKSFKYLEIGVTNGMVYDLTASPPESPSATFTSTMASISTSSTGGTIGVVPEPTSGLLLLVGMAGLALRRKQK